jgi:hypothetical protein
MANMIECVKCRDKFLLMVAHGVSHAEELRRNSALQR